MVGTDNTEPSRYGWSTMAGPLTALGRLLSVAKELYQEGIHYGGDGPAGKS